MCAKRPGGVIHLAFNHDFGTFKANCEAVRCAIGALGPALTGFSRLLIVTSGTAMTDTARSAGNRTWRGHQLRGDASRGFRRSCLS